MSNSIFPLQVLADVAFAEHRECEVKFHDFAPMTLISIVAPSGNAATQIASRAGSGVVKYVG